MIKVKNSRLIIPTSDKYLGFQHDNNVKTLEFEINDVQLSQLLFKIDIEEPNVTVTPTKTLNANGHAVLTWNITSGITAYSGILKFQLRAFDGNGEYIWHSEVQELYIFNSIEAKTDYTEKELSDFEKIEISVTQKAQSASDDAMSAQNSKDLAELAQQAAQSAKEDSQAAARVSNAAASSALQSQAQAEEYAQSASAYAQAASRAEEAAREAENSAKSHAQGAVGSAADAKGYSDSAKGYSESAKEYAENIITGLDSKASNVHSHPLAATASSEDLSTYAMSNNDTDGTAQTVYAAKGIGDYSEYYVFSWYSWHGRLFKAGDIVSLTIESDGGNFWCSQANIMLSSSGTARIECLVLDAPLEISGSFGGARIRVDELISGGDGFMSSADKVKLDGIESITPLTPSIDVEYASEVVIKPNTETNIGVLTGDIDISLAEGKAGFANEWIFILTQGSTAYDIALPEIQWTLGIAPSFGENSITEVRLHCRSGVLEGVWN